MQGETEKRLVFFRGRWHVYVGSGKSRRRFSLGTADRAAAERALAELTKPAKSARLTCGEIVRAYLSDCESRLTAPDKPKFGWKRLEPYCATLPPDAITRAWCDSYIADRRRHGYKDSTIAISLGVLRAALRWHDPHTSAVIKLPPQSPPKDRWLTKEEAAQLVDACKDAHLKLFVEIGLKTGARSNAILSLTWDRVNFERGEIDFRLLDGKRRKGRSHIAIPNSLLERLREARKFAVTAYVIEYAGEPVARIVKGFRSAARRAGLPDVTPHTLRHTAAVRMAEAGVPLYEIAQYLGHRDSRTTERIYARFAPNHMSRARAALEE